LWRVDAVLQTHINAVRTRFEIVVEVYRHGSVQMTDCSQLTVECKQITSIIVSVVRERRVSACEIPVDNNSTKLYFLIH